jgi:AcrR family transcriptional regulator
MQATTCMPAPRPITRRPRSANPKKDTQTRLLNAAERMFAREGLDAATTRGIARAAGVNEVTLFRHFGSKEGILAAVVARSFGVRPEAAHMADTGDLAADRAGWAARYESQLRENLLLVRTCVGEIHRHQAYEGRVLHAIFAPLRSALIDRLKKAADRGEGGSAADPEIVADLLSGMIFTGVLREASGVKPRSYSPASYRAAALRTIQRALA